jgi:geranylgeranyl pyrophosphate synthase
LPAMDNADLRRGLATCHKAFGEATAILVGDALQALAFQLLSRENLSPLSPLQQLKMVQILAQACGSSGMVGGQMLDLQATGQTLSLAELTAIYRGKTGALFKAAIQLGLLAGMANPSKDLLEVFPDTLGLAFQIQDDLLDIEANTLVIGKNTKSDAYQGKTTYPIVAGIEAARAQVATLYLQAQTYLKDLDERAKPLRDLITAMRDRHY